MTADIELLPCGECGMPCLPGEYHPYAACLLFRACRNSDTVRGNLQDAQDHFTAAQAAEIEALLAEREVIGAEAVKYAGKSGRLEARAERLAEALQLARDLVEDWAGYAGEYFQKKHNLEGDLALLDDALRDHDQEARNG